MDHRWNNTPVWTPPPTLPEPPKVLNNFTPVVTTPVTPQPIPRVVPPEIVTPLRPPPVVEIPVIPTIPVMTPTTPVTPVEPFGGFLKEKLTASASLLLPVAKTSSHDPRLNPSLAVDAKKEELSTPKKKVKISTLKNI
jgi:hypothetical protein